MDAEAQALLIQQKKVQRSELKKMICLSKWDELKELYPGFTPRFVKYGETNHFDWTSLTPYGLDSSD